MMAVPVRSTPCVPLGRTASIAERGCQTRRLLRPPRRACAPTRAASPAIQHAMTAVPVRSSGCATTARIAAIAADACGGASRRRLRRRHHHRDGCRRRRLRRLPTSCPRRRLRPRRPASRSPGRASSTFAASQASRACSIPRRAARAHASRLMPPAPRPRRHAGRCRQPATCGRSLLAVNTAPTPTMGRA